MELYIHDTPLSQVPVGWQSLTLVRQRNVFGGFSQRRTAILRENSLTISDPQAVAIIRQAWQEKLHNAELTISVREGSNILLESQVDWNVYSQTREGVTIGLVDRQGLLFLEALQRVYALRPAATFRWQALPLGGAVTSRIHEERQVVTVESHGVHAVPFKGNSQSHGVGEYRDVEGTSAHWVNTTGGELTMQVEMVVNATVTSRGSSPYHVGVQLYDAQGAFADRRLVGRYTPGASTWVFSQAIKVPPGYGLGVIVISPDTPYSFQYAPGSELSIEEQAGAETSVPVVRLDTLLADWSRRSGLGLYLDWPPVQHLYLTCGAWLRGAENRELNLNMEALLTDLSRLFRIQAGQQDGSVYVKEPTPLSGGFWAEKVNEVEYPTSDLFYGSIGFGYDLWRSNSVAGQQEPNHRVTYATPFPTREALDLTATYVSASHKLIESLVRKRSSHLSAATDEEHDAQPFLLTDQPGLLSLDAQIQRYSEELAYNYPLTLISKEGEQAQDVVFSLKTARYEPLGCLVDVSLSLEEFDALDELISFNDQGRNVTVEIQQAEYALSEGKAIITGHILCYE